jgi:hypothetical protein
MGKHWSFRAPLLNTYVENQLQIKPPARLSDHEKIMPITHNRREGTLDQVHRAKGPDVWVYRWREVSPARKRVQRKRVIGTIDKLKTETAAKKSG